MRHTCYEHIFRESNGTNRPVVNDANILHCEAERGILYFSNMKEPFVSFGNNDNNNNNYLYYYYRYIYFRKV